MIEFLHTGLQDGSSAPPTFVEVPTFADCLRRLGLVPEIADELVWTIQEPIAEESRADRWPCLRVIDRPYRSGGIISIAYRSDPAIGQVLLLWLEVREEQRSIAA